MLIRNFTDHQLILQNTLASMIYNELFEVSSTFYVKGHLYNDQFCEMMSSNA